MAEALIQILKDTQTDPEKQKIIYPQTVGQAVYLDINNKKINLQTAIDSELIGPSGGELKVSSIIIDKKTNQISLPTEFKGIENSKQILVFQNGLILVEGQNYKFNTSSLMIELIGDDYNARIGDIFTFLYIAKISINDRESLNKTMVITSKSSNDEIPTAKAVYDYINSLVNESY